MNIKDRISIPDNARYLELFYKGSGNPADEHEIIGVRIVNANGRQVGVATGEFPDDAVLELMNPDPATKPEQMSPEVERLKYLKSREVNAAGGTSLSDAEDAELAEMTGQFAPRDATKPEQTP